MTLAIERRHGKLWLVNLGEDEEDAELLAEFADRKAIEIFKEEMEWALHAAYTGDYSVLCLKGE
jgi:hypothetical protein